jgi:alpha-L-fucosidase 2
MLLALLSLCMQCALAFAPSDALQWTVNWLTPTTEPGRSQGGKSTYQGAMPLGNGRLTVLGWANATSGGIGFYLGHQDAMSSNTDLFKLALLQVSLSPSPFSQGSFFNQSLDLSTATLRLYAGGTSLSDYAVLFEAYVDANADQLLLSVASRDPSKTYSLTATLSSTRPAARWQQQESFADCAPVFNNPDVALDPLPAAPIPLARPPPQSEAEKFRHATGATRPQRALARLPPLAAFQPGSLIWYHRNAPEDGLTIPTTLTLQHLEALIPTTPDYWQDLQFGFALDAGAGAPLTRSSNTTLTSAAPGAAFSLRATVLAVQTDTVEEWVADLAALVAEGDAGAAGARVAHEAYWGGFWARSHIVVNASDPSPTSPAAQLNSMYAITRYTQVIQSRGTKWPIKFNGMAFVAAVGSNGEAEYRDWGASNWWQNTRLPYGAMLAAGDFDEFKVILDYIANQEVLLGQRTLAYWNHTGMWTTETTHLSGAYDNTGAFLY